MMQESIKIRKFANYLLKFANLLIISEIMLIFAPSY